MPSAPAKSSRSMLPTPRMPKGLPQAEISENAYQVLTRRYIRKGENGELTETPEEMFWRVAWHIAKVEKAWGADVNDRAVEFYQLLVSRRFFPNSPTFTGAGTPLGQLAACFVLPIADDMGRASDGIFQTLRDAALIQQTGGGNGFSFSSLRPSGSLVNASAGRATGPIGFLRVYDNAFGEIAQGGTRRGANMAVLRVDHPDIEDFIVCKTNETPSPTSISPSASPTPSCARWRTMSPGSCASPMYTTPATAISTARWKKRKPPAFPSSPIRRSARAISST